MTDTIRNPAELRSMFGENLKQLARSYPSVSELCRQLGINRTQFNRYLGGESFPRPDVLDRICRFFAVDARILLKPLEEIETPAAHPASDTIDRFLAAGTNALFAPGFYHAIEADLNGSDAARHQLLLVRRIGHCALLRGYEPHSAMPGEPAPARELQGVVTQSGTQICALMSRQGGRDCRVMVVTPQPSDTELRWLGYLLRLPDRPAPDPNIQRLELRHLAYDLSAALRLRRRAPHAPEAR